MFTNSTRRNLQPQIGNILFRGKLFLIYEDPMLENPENMFEFYSVGEEGGKITCDASLDRPRSGKTSSPTRKVNTK